MTIAVPALDGAGAGSGAAAGGPASGPASGNVLVRLAGVSKSYAAHSVPALAPLDLEIRQGEFFSLLGPSGSGKTTTLRLIAGFEIPDTGQVLLDGVDVTWEPPFRRDVRTVFQSYALFPHMTIEQNVAYPLRMAGVPRPEMAERVRRALALVEMVGFESRLPHQLSGGQRQRVALARALVGRPKVLLLDEPLGALDLQLRQQMQLVLRDLQREVGITFIYVTHDQGEALSMSDRLAVMDHGRLQQVGTPEAVYYRPANRFVAGFIGRSNLLACEVLRQGEAALARTSAGLLALDGTHAAGPATLAIRYEALSLAPPGPPAAGESRIRATVDSHMFLGDVRELVVRAGEYSLALRVPALRPLPARGEAIELSVLNRDLVVLRD